MRPFIFICTAVLAAGLGAFAQDVSLSDVTKAFKDAKIPGDLSINFDPQALLDVTFPQESGKPITLKAGVQLPRNATKGPPNYRLRGLRYPGPYVIASVDPDAPTPENPSVAQIRHYLGVILLLTGNVRPPSPITSDSDDYHYA
ncbi:hypothetical protein EST38_g8115 [Candolleomyces aberdarensis]|uniref:Uncharacterized protein n=1 Tax=Candolleomyces aberdarensis TaxID=2316362 RepID=A0A4Q2DFG3_9AGAR|nr:hypothetical protein EST38_g8115 [Candolleomyces aberdarensis]